MVEDITNKNVVSMIYKPSRAYLSDENGYSLFKTRLFIAGDIIRRDYGEFVSCDVVPYEDLFSYRDFWIFMEAEEESKLESALKGFFSISGFPYFLHNISNYELVDKILRNNKKCLMRIWWKNLVGRYVVDSE